MLKLSLCLIFVNLRLLNIKLNIDYKIFVQFSILQHHAAHSLLVINMEIIDHRGMYHGPSELNCTPILRSS